MSGEFSFKTLFPTYQNNFRGQLQREVHEEMFKAKLECYLIAVVFFIFIFLNISFQYGVCLLVPPYEKFNGRLNRTSLYRSMPFDTYFPFDVSISDGHFWIGWLTQFYFQYIPPCIFAGMQIVRSDIRLIEDVFQ